MKNPIIRTASLSLMCLFALLLTACNTNTIHTSTSDVVPIPEKPNDLQMSEDLISGRIEAESSDERSEAEEEIIEEAMTAVRDTKSAITALEEKNGDAALQILERAIGKLEIVLARNPRLALVPIESNVTMNELVADIEAIRLLRKQAEDALEQKDVQTARRLLRGAASEIMITNVNLPLQTYPQAIRAAVRLVDQGKFDDARLALEAVLNTLVLTEDHIPLPIIRAQAMLEEATNVLEESKEENKTQALNLVANAEYQLRFAEELGYGDWDKEYGEIQRKLQEIEGRIEQEEVTTELLKTLRNKIQLFKERIQ